MILWQVGNYSVIISIIPAKGKNFPAYFFISVTPWYYLPSKLLPLPWTWFSFYSRAEDLSLEETLTRGSLVAASSVKCWYASVYKLLLRSMFVMADPSKRAWFGSKSEDLAKHSSSYYPIKNKVSNLLSVTDSRHFWSKQHFSSLTSSLLNILWEKLCSKC